MLDERSEKRHDKLMEAVGFAAVGVITCGIEAYAHAPYLIIAAGLCFWRAVRLLVTNA